MKKVYTLIMAILLLSPFGCYNNEELIPCCDTGDLVKDIKLVNKDGNWAKSIDFSKIRLFETNANGDFLKDKNGSIYNEIEGLTKAKTIYDNKNDSIPTRIKLYLGHHLGYDKPGYFSLKINDSIYHKIVVNYDKIDNKLKIKDFKYQNENIFRINNGILEIPMEEESEPSPEPPVSNKCEDPNAVNKGGDLPCEYPPKCEDPNAVNKGRDLPCRYPPPPMCEDPNAINKGGDLPCEYPQLHPPFKTLGPVYLRDWMKHVHDNALISALSIPGTHNSGARKSQEVNISKCQDMDFEEQLNRGIRFFDIRINLSLNINHGGYLQYENLKRVVEIFEDFLRSHSTETVIMSIKQEGSNSSNFANAVESVINKNRDLWYLDTKIPKMGEVRGKIILFRRFPDSKLGIPMSYWPDNRTFTSGDVSVQDWYNIGGLNNDNVAKKWNDAVKGLIYKANSREGNRLYINFLSASGGAATPNHYAWGRKLTWDEWWNIWLQSSNGVLQYFDDYLKNSSPRSKTFGVMVMDYPSEYILRMLVNTNF